MCCILSHRRKDVKYGGHAAENQTLNELLDQAVTVAQERVDCLHRTTIVHHQTFQAPQMPIQQPMITPLPQNATGMGMGTPICYVQGADGRLQPVYSANALSAVPSPSPVQPGVDMPPVYSQNKV